MLMKITAVDLERIQQGFAHPAEAYVTNNIGEMFIGVAFDINGEIYKSEMAVPHPGSCIKKNEFLDYFINKTKHEMARRPEKKIDEEPNERSWK